MLWTSKWTQWKLQHTSWALGAPMHVRLGIMEAVVPKMSSCLGCIIYVRVHAGLGEACIIWADFVFLWGWQTGSMCSSEIWDPLLWMLPHFHGARQEDEHQRNCYRNLFWIKPFGFEATSASCLFFNIGTLPQFPFAQGLHLNCLLPIKALYKQPLAVIQMIASSQFSLSVPERKWFIFHVSTDSPHPVRTQCSFWIIALSHLELRDYSCLPLFWPHFMFWLA